MQAETTPVSQGSARHDRSRLERLRIVLLRSIFVLQLGPILLLAPVWEAMSPMRMVLTTAGTLCVIAAVLGRLWAILYIGGHKNRTVMREGPYSLCRHPLYLASSIGALGLGLLLGSITLALVTGGATLAVLMATARDEERHLRRLFGTDYDRYAREVPLLWPRISRFHTPRIVSFDAEKLRINLADALVFLGFIPFATAVELLHGSGVLPGFLVY